MALPPAGDELDIAVEAEDAMVAQSDKHHISTILIVISMQTEALPLVDKLQLTEDVNSVFPKGVPWIRYHGTYKDLSINLVWPGKDAASGVDSVGTVSASLITYAAIQTLQPDLVINAGTCGGFKAKGASVGDILLASGVAFHDRRIPIPVSDLYGVGLREAFSTPNLVKELNLKNIRYSEMNAYGAYLLMITCRVDPAWLANCLTGDSLDMSQQDETSIFANDATVKDMEGAAIAYVTDLLKVPAIFLKAVTDIVDGDKPTSEEFLQNLAVVTAALEQAVTQVIDFIYEKSFSEL